MREPIVREPNDREKVPALVADLSVRAVWQQPQATTFFDVRVVDSDANSYLHRDVGAVFSLIEHTKKQKYSQAAETINASFTPFVVTADGALGLEAKTFIRHLAEKFGTSPTVKCWAMCVPECFLLSFVLRISAFAAAE